MSSSTVDGAEAASVAGVGGTRTSPEYQGHGCVFLSYGDASPPRCSTSYQGSKGRPRSVPGGHDGT